MVGGPCDNQRVCCYHVGHHCQRKLISCVLLVAFFFGSWTENENGYSTRRMSFAAGDVSAEGWGCVMRRRESASFVV